MSRRTDTEHQMVWVRQPSQYPADKSRRTGWFGRVSPVAPRNRDGILLNGSASRATRKKSSGMCLGVVGRWRRNNLAAVSPTCAFPEEIKRVRRPG